jgi:transposase
MSLRPEPLPPIPDVTAAAVRAAFPKGNVYVALRAEFGTLYDDQLFADLYPPEGRPVEVPPWRLALVMVMQYMEGLTERQAADAVRRCMDWKYALSLDLHDPGFDFTLLHDLVAYPHVADNISRLLPSRLRDVTQPGVRSQIGLSVPRSVLLAWVWTWLARSIVRAFSWPAGYRIWGCGHGGTR